MTKTHLNILIFHPDSSEAEEYARLIGKHGFSSVTYASTKEDATKALPGTEAILAWKFPTELLNDPVASSVRWFQSMGAGVDDLVDDVSMPDRIQITRIVDQFGTYISEYVFTFLLNIVKDQARMNQAQQDKRWDPFIADTLEGKTIGVAGLGSIGTEIVRKARAFDMNVHGLSSSGEQAHLVDAHFDSKQWTEFVSELDVLVLTLPLTKETHHVINKQLLSTMKADACLINVGRGPLIVEDDLYSVMQAGHLRAAVLDVFEKEPLPKEHPFWSMPNVYVTSHLSGPSTSNHVSRFFIDNLNRYVQGETLQGIVDRGRGY